MATAVADTLLLARRNLVHYWRIPSLIVFSTVTPVMFVVLFGYVFGGAIHVPGLSYIDFLLPGVFVMTVAFGAIQSGVGLAEDLSEGIVDRLRSLPTARSAVLAGRTLADTVRNLAVVGIMAGVGLVIGFRFHGGPVAALAGLGLVVLFAFACSWVSAVVGLSVGSIESAQSAGIVWVFPLTFASSTFVPVSTMPGWLEAFARVNPVTHVVDALRGLFLGGAAAGPALRSLAWIVAILAVFGPLAVARFRRI